MSHTKCTNFKITFSTTGNNNNSANNNNNNNNNNTANNNILGIYSAESNNNNNDNNDNSNIQLCHTTSTTPFYGLIKEPVILIIPINNEYETFQFCAIMVISKGESLLYDGDEGGENSWFTKDDLDVFVLEITTIFIKVDNGDCGVVVKSVVVVVVVDVVLLVVSQLAVNLSRISSSSFGVEEKELVKFEKEVDKAGAAEEESHKVISEKKKLHYAF
ncbi:hypothetical protein Glove_433g12 [Diversispora epigaea]|uniref:Uncharacterized protein n=1 Tax=Diversispora epigaea TaxID=1348612 RepID=A0A397GWK7_9GLOM|nr:hypothetical protein Glove_433g12 [Diversispora epigaea]